jgi:flavin-dependent dehydrogenase
LSTIYDFIVVGARVAGAACALLLARRGARVLAIDRAPLGSDTLSTHFIWPRGIRRLDEMGVFATLLKAQTPPIERIIFEPGCNAVITSTPELAALCPRRTVLDRLLVEAAAAAGAEFRHKTAVDGLVVEAGRVRGVRTASGIERAELVIGADGRMSDVARMMCAEVVEAHAAQTAGFYAYFDGLSLNGAEFRVREGRLTYVWPTNDGLACVYVAGRQAGFRALREQVHAHGLAAATIEDPSLVERLAAARQASRLHGFAGQGPLRRRRYGPGWVLIGDAASFKDPTAGMGISEALDDAAWIASGAPWEERDGESARIFDFCRRAAELEGVDDRLSATYRLIAGRPDWSEAWFAVLAGEREPRDFFAQLTQAELAERAGIVSATPPPS